MNKPTTNCLCQQSSLAVSAVLTAASSKGQSRDMYSVYKRPIAVIVMIPCSRPQWAKTGQSKYIQSNCPNLSSPACSISNQKKHKQNLMKEVVQLLSSVS